MTLNADVVVDRPGHRLDVSLVAEPGDVVAVVGPNGSGKTTLLRALAGLVPLTGGRVECGGTVWEDTETGARATAQRRNIGMVPQDILLFPHLSALDNVAFGPRARGVRRADARRRAGEWLSRLGVGELADRKPAELSGGQAQRVAVARALATRPDVLLLDEPLSALDVGVAMGLRLELARHLAEFGGISLLVTHDAIDALTIANRVLVLDDGTVAQQGTPADVSRHPRTEHVARLVGLNVLTGFSHDTLVRLTHGEVVTTTPYDGPAQVVFSPSAVTLTVEPASGSARNQWRGQVLSVVPHGSAVRVHLDAAGGLIADVTPAAAAQLGLTPGRKVYASVKATEVRVYGGTEQAPPAPIGSGDG